MANKINKQKVRSLEFSIKVLEEELKDPHTVRLGQAAIDCVQETLDQKRRELSAYLLQNTEIPLG